MDTIRRDLPIGRRERAGIIRRHLQRHIERVFRIAPAISLVIHSVMLASRDMVRRNREVAQVVGRFDEGSDETRSDVVLNVTMEEPHSWIISLEPPYRHRILVQHDCISSDGGLGGGIGVISPIPFVPRVGIPALQYLVLMTMKMHRV